MATILASTTLAMLHEAERMGLSRISLLRAAGLEGVSLERPDARIPREADTALWHEIARQSGDLDIGLRFAASESTAGAFGLVGFLAMASADLRHAIMDSHRYHRVLKDDVTVRMVAVGSGLLIDPGTPPGQAASSRPYADYAVASYVALGRRWTGVRLCPVEVRFRHAAPRDTAAYDALFGCPVRFDQPENGLVLDHDTLGLPLLTAQPDLARYLGSLADATAADLRPSEVAADVRDALRRGLAAGDTGLASIARRLRMSARTLQRRLEVRGLAYRDLVEEVRHAEAIQLVADSDMPIELISERLGYSDARAFRRAFQRWVGVSPAALRRAGAGRSVGERAAGGPSPTGSVQSR